MNIQKAFSVIAVLVLGAVMIVPAARADQWDQATKFTIDQPFEVPGMILPAGTYWFQVMSNTSDVTRNIVNIYNADRTHLYTAVMAVPKDRIWVSDATELKITEPTGRQVAALLSWTYPDSLSGHEFVYPDRQRESLAEEPTQTVMAVPGQSVTLNANASIAGD